MKLPLQTNKQVQPIRRIASSLPASVSNAQGKTIQSFQRTMDTLGDIGMTIFKQNAAAEHSKLNAEYIDQMNTAKTELEREPYREEMDSEGNPTGTLISRHAEIMEEYNVAEERIRKGILSKATNNLAIRKLSTDFEDGAVAYREGIRTTAARWSVADSRKNFIESFRTNIINRTFASAERDITMAMQTGSITPTEAANHGAELLAAKEYYVNDLKIQSITNRDSNGNLSHSIEQISSMHEMFNGLKNITETQRKSLSSKLDYKIQDMMAEDVMLSIDAMSLADGEAIIRGYMKRPWFDSGFSSERSYETAIGHLWTVYNHRKEKAGLTEKEIRINELASHVHAGRWMSYDHPEHKKAMDIVWKERTKGLEPGSNEWIRATGKQAIVQGWLAPEAEHWVKGNLVHMSPESDLGSVLAASRVVGYLDRHSSRAIDRFSKNEIAIALTINEAALNGTPSIESFIKIREGIERIPEATRSDREKAYNAQHSNNAGAILIEKVEQDDSFWNFGTPDINQVMTEHYDRLVRQNFVLTGNKQVAETLAYSEFKKTYGINERGEGRSVDFKAPEVMLRDVSPEKVKEYVTEEYNDLMQTFGVDGADYMTVYRMGDDAENSWFLINKETGDFLSDKNGMVVSWKPSYDTSRLGQRDMLNAELARIDAEIELAREQAELEAKHSLFSTDIENLTVEERLEREYERVKDSYGKPFSEWVREAAKQDVEAGATGFGALLGPYYRSSPERETSRKSTMRRRKYERLKNQVNAPKGSRLETAINRRRAIEEALEELD